MTLYEVLLFVHILAAMVWVGGGILLTFISARVQATGDAAYRARFAKSAGVVGPLSGVSALLVLGAGIGMVLNSEAIAFTDLWVWLAVVLFSVSILGGIAFFGPASGRIERALEAGDVETADRGARTFNLVARLDLLVLLVILRLMVFKPGV